MFQTSFYTTFNSHGSRTHSEYDWRMLKSEIISGDIEENDELEPVSLDEIQYNENL